MAACLSGEEEGVGLLMRNGCTWRTIVSVLQTMRWWCLFGARCLVTAGVHTVVSIVLRRQTGAGLLWNARLAVRS